MSCHQLIFTIPQMHEQCELDGFRLLYFLSLLSHLRKVTAKPSLKQDGSLSNVEPADSKVRSKQSVHDVSAFFNTLGSNSEVVPNLTQHLYILGDRGANLNKQQWETAAEARYGARHQKDLSLNSHKRLKLGDRVARPIKAPQSALDIDHQTRDIHEDTWTWQWIKPSDSRSAGGLRKCIRDRTEQEHQRIRGAASLFPVSKPNAGGDGFASFAGAPSTVASAASSGKFAFGGVFASGTDNTKEQKSESQTGTSVFGRTKSESHSVFEQPSAGGAFGALKSVSSSVSGAPQAAFRESVPSTHNHEKEYPA
ncbi:hypothetical protein F5877DRAFT_71333 [Lentinula edodes]|nr:hypothetical protein F5877DRAFT_71333 [Lentinula edodes]